MENRRERASTARRRVSGLVVGVALAAAVTVVIALLEPGVPAINFLVLYLLAVLPVAVLYGAAPAAITSVVSVLLFSYLFATPRHSIGITQSGDLIAIGVFFVTAVVVGQLAARLRWAALESARLTEEQSALRRVATLVAESEAPSAVFQAVTREVGQLCGADVARMERYEEDGTVTGVAAWSRGRVGLAVGTHLSLDGTSIAREVQETGAPARVDSLGGATGEIAREGQELGIRSSVGCPIVVEGRLWGVIAASRKTAEPFPARTQLQIARFTELVATAIANAESRRELAASRARVVTAADRARHRLERDLHDGAQQRLVSLALELRLAQEDVPDDLPELRTAIGRVADELNDVLDELREISRGLHPAGLSERGLRAALRALARRSAVPVEVHGEPGRFPEAVELTAYYVVCEAVANASKHARASHVDVLVEAQDGTLRLRVSDDGVGGADPRKGSGLVGLKDRVAAVQGSMQVSSPPGQGTRLDVVLPLREHDAEHMVDQL